MDEIRGDDLRHSWSEAEVREMAYDTFAGDPEKLAMLDDGRVPKH